MTETSGLVLLAAALSNAKAAEAQAKAARIVCEESIIIAAGFKKPEGQETYKEEGEHGRCSIVIKQPVTTTVDSDAWVRMRRTLRRNHPAREIFVAKYSLDTKSARVLQETNKLAWAEVSGVVTRKPGKVSVEVKEVAATIPLSIVDSTKRLGHLGATEVNVGDDFEDAAAERTAPPISGGPDDGGLS